MNAPEYYVTRTLPVLFSNLLSRHRLQLSAGEADHSTLGRGLECVELYSHDSVRLRGVCLGTMGTLPEEEDKKTKNDDDDNNNNNNNKSSES